MERDFLGISAGKKEAKGSRRAAGLAVQWPSKNQASSMQQFMSYTAAAGERRNIIGFDQSSSSTFQPVKVVNSFEISNNSFSAQAQQKSFNLQNYQVQGTTTFGVSSHKMSENRTFPLVAHHTIPVASNNPGFKFHCTQNSPSITITTLNHQPFRGVAFADPTINTNVEAIASRNVPKPGPVGSQLTIFYAGAVHVFDDVPVDKAQAIMTLASKGSNSTLNASRTEAPFTAAAPMPTEFPSFDGFTTKQILNPNPIRVVSPHLGFLDPVPVTCSAVANFSGLNTNTGTADAEVVISLTPSIKQEPSVTLSPALGSPSNAAAVPRAVPQARKASLARFLEKRKERVDDAMPYSSNSTIKKIAATGSGHESANASSICSSPEVNHSSNLADSLGLGHPKSSGDTGESPSTKLDITSFAPPDWEGKWP